MSEAAKTQADILVIGDGSIRRIVQPRAADAAMSDWGSWSAPMSGIEK